MSHVLPLYGFTMEPETSPREMQRRFILLYGLRVKVMRKTRRLSGTEVAKQIRSSFSKLSRLETGNLKLSPNYHFTLSLSEALGVPPLALLPRGSDYRDGWPCEESTAEPCGQAHDNVPVYIALAKQTIPAMASLLNRFDHRCLGEIRELIDESILKTRTDSSSVKTISGLTDGSFRPYVPVQAGLEKHLRQAGHTMTIEELKMGLRLCRETRGSTLSDLSNRTGIELPQMWDIENNQISVPTWRVVAICQALRIDPTLFFPDSVSPGTPFEPNRIVDTDILNLVLDICMLCTRHSDRTKANRLLQILTTIDTFEGIERSINLVQSGKLS